MSVSFFQKGALVKIDGLQHVMKHQVDSELWQLEIAKTGRILEFKIGELRKLYAEGRLVFFDERHTDKSHERHIPGLSDQTVAAIPSFTVENWERAKLKRHFVMAVMGVPVTEEYMVATISKAAKGLPAGTKIPHWITVARWKKTFIQFGKDINHLIDRNRNKGNRTRRYPKEVLQIVEDAVEGLYLAREKRSVEEVLNHAIITVERENKLRLDSNHLPTPSRRIVEMAINAIPAFDRCVAREGRTAALRRFRSVLHQYTSQRALERTEIDHTQLDLFVLDDKTLLPLGRPWVTVCIDVHTRCILGTYIGFEPPSFLTVSRCLKHAFLPKTNLQADFPEINHAWDAHGVMENLVVDNGLEFHSDSLEKVCLPFGINITFAPRKTPWFKGKIERFFGTLNREVAHPTPGTTFSNIFEKDEYDPSKHAVVTLSTLKLVVHKWIADVYHQRPHRGLERATPAQIWASSVRTEEIPLPDDHEQLEAMMGTNEKRVLTHKGIELQGLVYNSPDLTLVRRELGDKLEVEVRINQDDLGVIYVQPPGQQIYIRVPALQRDYANGLTKFQHTIIKRYTSKFLDATGVNGWRQGKAEIYEIIKDSIHVKRIKSRSKIARFNETPKIFQPVSSLQANAISISPKHHTDDFLVDLGPKVTISNSRPKFVPIIETRSTPYLIEKE